MSIRAARKSDLTTIATLAAAAFYDDELFGGSTAASREQHYTDYESSFQRRIRENWCDHHRVWWVATVQESGTEIVVGVAEWELLGSAGEEYKLGRLDPRRASKPLVKTYYSISSALRPNRAANSSSALRDSAPSTQHFFARHWTDARANSFYLDLLAIDPQYQGQGHGKALVQWGLNQAREEGVCASVVSSTAGYPFYLKMGFVQEVGTVEEGKGNPLKGNVGGWILFTPLPQEGDAADAGGSSTAEDIELFRAALKSAQTRPQTSSGSTT